MSLGAGGGGGGRRVAVPWGAMAELGSAVRQASVNPSPRTWLKTCRYTPQVCMPFLWKGDDCEVTFREVRIPDLTSCGVVTTVVRCQLLFQGLRSHTSSFAKPTRLDI